MSDVKQSVHEHVGFVPSLIQACTRASTVKIACFIFLLALLPRLFIGLTHATFHNLDNVEFNLIAESWAEGRGFGNPFSADVQTGPTAFDPPIYEAVQAAIFSVFGSGPAGSRALVIVSSIITATLCAIWIWVSERVGIPRLCGVFAGITGALIPLHAWIEIKGSYEVVLATLCAAVLIGMIVYDWRTQSFRARNALRAGGFAGIAVMVSSSLYAVTFPLLAAGFFFVGRLAFRRYARYVVVASAIFFAFQLPWVIRNWVTLGRPILMRDNLGLELWVSNNPVAAPNQEQNATRGYPYVQHPYVSEAGLAEVKRVGELAFIDACGRKASQWIRANPQRFLELTVARIGLFWFPLMARPWQTAARWLVTLGGFWGFVLLLRRRHPLGIAIAAIWAGYPLVYYLVNAQDRFAYPVYQLELLLFAYAVVSVLPKTPQNPAAPEFA